MYNIVNIVCFAMRSSSAHDGKIKIFEIFQSPLTNIIQLN